MVEWRGWWAPISCHASLRAAAGQIFERPATEQPCCENEAKMSFSRLITAEK